MASKRAESGVMQFPDDWPGMFLRGDRAIIDGFSLQNLADYLLKTYEGDPKFPRFEVQKLVSLGKFLQTCHAKNNPEAQLAELRPNSTAGDPHA